MNSKALCHECVRTLNQRAVVLFYEVRSEFDRHDLFARLHLIVNCVTFALKRDHSVN